jgi:hypothetical protein
VFGEFRFIIYIMLNLITPLFLFYDYPNIMESGKCRNIPPAYGRFRTMEGTACIRRYDYF